MNKVATFNIKIFPHNFHVFRKDRVNRTLGCVLITISVVFSSYLLELVTPSEVEFVAVRVKLDNKGVFITCPYILYMVLFLFVQNMLL